MDVGGLVVASQTPSVVQTSFRVIRTDVVVVPRRQLFNTFLNASEREKERRETVMSTVDS